MNIFKQKVMGQLTYQAMCMVSFSMMMACDNLGTQGLSDGSVKFDGISSVDRTMDGKYVLNWRPAQGSGNIVYEVYVQSLGEVEVTPPEGSEPFLSLEEGRVAFKARASAEIAPSTLGQVLSTVDGGYTSYELDIKFKPRTTYVFQVRARDKNSATDSNQVVAYLSASADSLYQGCLEAVPVSGSEIRVTLDFPDGAQAVRVMRDDIEVFKTQRRSASSFLDKELILGKSYQYKCIASFGNDTWEGVNQPSVAPKNPLTEYAGCTTATVNGVDIKLDFEYPEGADEVVVYRDDVAVFTSQSPAGRSFIDPDLSPGRNYRYSCEARMGSESIVGLKRLDIEIPNPFATYQGCTHAVATGSSSIRVTYDFPKEADRVTVYRNGIKVFSTSSPAEIMYTDTGLKEANPYEYLCEAAVGSFSQKGEQGFTVNTLSTNPPTFSGIIDAVIQSANSVQLTWGVPATSGVSAAYFRIYATLGNNVNYDADPIATIQAGTTTHLLQNLGDELSYSFAVRACSIENICDTNTANIKLNLPDGGSSKAIGAFSATVVNGKIILSMPWKAADGAISKRRVYRRSGSVGGLNVGDYTLVSTIVVTDTIAPQVSAEIGNILENTTYHFVVVDEDPSGNFSTPTQFASVTTGDLTPPSFSGIGSLSVGPNGKKDTALTLGFLATAVEPSDPDGANAYVAFIKEGGGDACTSGKVVAEFPAVLFTEGDPGSFVIEGLKKRTFYSVCLKARDSSGNMSNSTSFLQKYTLDLDPPNFDGVQSVAYNPNNGKIEVIWNPSTSVDVKEYRIKVWKNKTIPLDSDISTFLKAHQYFSNGFSFSGAEFAFIGDDMLHVLVDACDDAATIPDGTQNCTTMPMALQYKVPDVTPPQGFEGIMGSSFQQTPSEGVVDIYWKAPVGGDYNDYRGFRIFILNSTQGIPTDANLVFVKDCPCSAANCPEAPTSCRVSGLNPNRTYTFHVRAYDSNGNVTTYLNPAVASTSKKTLDTTPPSFSSNLTLAFDEAKITLNYATANDNQYPLEPGVQLLYEIYRRAGTTFTNSQQPFADGDTTLMGSIIHTSYTDQQLQSNVTYFYTVCAIDASANRTCDGVVRSYTTPDVEPPVIESFNTEKLLDEDLKIWDINWVMNDNSNKSDLRVTLKYMLSSDQEAPTNAASYPFTIVETEGIETYADLSGPPDVNIFVHYHLTVKDQAGNSTFTTLSVFSKNEVRIDRILRDSGSMDGGRLVVLEGEGFALGANVRIGGLDCLFPTTYHQGAIGCVTPPQSEGNYTVSVVNPGNTGSAILASGYTYVDPTSPSAHICDRNTSQGAGFPQGNGTVGDPYMICNHLQLNALRTVTHSRYFEFHDNVDLSYYGDNTFAPLTNSGRNDIYFTNIEGNGFYVANYTYKAPNTAYIGLFRDVYGPRDIKNLNLGNFDLEGRQYVGMLSGRIDFTQCGSVVENVTVSGKVKGAGSNDHWGLYGGLVGHLSRGSVINSKIFVNLTTDKKRVGANEHGAGGVTGLFHYCTISNTHVKGTIISKTHYTGGFIGQQSTGGTVTNSSFKGSIQPGDDVTNNHWFGGITGYAVGHSDPVYIPEYSNNTVEAKISGFYYMGGLIGYLESNGKVENNHFSGTLTATKVGEDMGGLIGRIRPHQQTVTIKGNTAQVDIDAPSVQLIGGAIGRIHMHGGLIGSWLIQDNHVKGTIKGNSNIGGFIGYCYECRNPGDGRTINGVIEKNSANVNIEALGANVGGFVGYFLAEPTTHTFRQNYASGSVESQSSCVGGFAGLMGNLIEDSYASGSVLGSDRVGGFVGCIYSHPSQYWSELRRVYARGKVFPGLGSDYGGLAAWIDVDINDIPIIYEASLWDTNAVGLDTSKGDPDEVIGQMSSQMKTQATYETMGWNFTPISGVWKLKFNGTTYPQLTWEK